MFGGNQGHHQVEGGGDGGTLGYGTSQPVQDAGGSA
jgi:hypothetical protein